MRKSFVNFQNKKDLFVNCKSSTFNKKTINFFIKTVVELNFSTTTEKDKIICNLCIMAVTSKYFSYFCVMLCGIPGVTLMGSIDDWILLKNKINYITNFGIENNYKCLVDWVKILLPIIDEFINSYNGNINNDFWQQCVNSTAYGSGSKYISGWVLAFEPFDKYGVWRLNNLDYILKNKNYGSIDATLFQSSTVDIPFILDNGSQTKGILHTGSIVNTYNQKDNTISPSYDYAVFLKQSPH